MLLLLWMFVLLMVTHGRKFHEQLDKQDLVYYFGVQEQQHVPPYMFIEKPTITSFKRKDGKIFSLRAFGERFIFKLRVNEEILTKDCVLQHFKSNGVVMSSPCSDHYRSCNYRGQSLSHKDGFAAISNCDILVGVISTSSLDLTILPLKTSHSSLLRSLNRTTPLEDAYIVNKLTRRAPGFQKKQMKTSHDIPITVEIVTAGSVVDSHANDKSLYGLNITTFLSINMNIVYSLFHDDTLTYHLSPSITRITTLNNTQIFGNMKDKFYIFDKFAEWHSHTSPLYRADLTLLVVTKEQIGEENKDEYDINGLAYLSGMCKDEDSKRIMAKDKGLGTAFTIAHEIGHTLRIGHDNDFPECHDSGNIMQRSATYGRSSFHWSSCSDNAMKAFFESDDSSCLQNRTTGSSNMTVLPGSLYDEEAQCKLTFGNNFTPNYYRKDKCSQLSCCYDQRHCINIGYPLMDGTECGNGTRTWCIRGQCVDIGADGPSPVHGGWSSWEMWSICSRTAGGGVRLRKRFCNNPKPRYTGNICFGSENEVRLCNIQPYGVSDTEFKELQLSQHHANFGCDGFLESHSTFDVCGVCNGNGTRCRGVTRVFDLPDQYDNEESDQIPIGDYYYDRYDIVLTRRQKWEEIHIIGPLEQDVEFQVEVIVQHARQYDLKINYTYYLPLALPDEQQYQWTSNWSSCSVTCGTGFMSLEHLCMDIETWEPVEDKNCDAKEYPVDNRITCNETQCSVA
ncbi:A disintegrin and metalloproteinase with thrombospondin motifs 18-like [Ylistrum balloti]|uniref:A disintegrin and metalloproteinase with thrombospondin motifs 18-like n=1 Tax=Ylistrum balloti TaxID=509963 RepID=UPI002905A683|nr:A disintegrin and metalloproteinase with thrombospondin motifs 18-like [Ylistrum balloti]